MKKIIFFGLAFMLLGTALFADDAKVMPMMVGRIYMAPTYSFTPGEYGTYGDRDYSPFTFPVKVINLGFALEYGVVNWITAAVQWVPGTTPWSDLSGANSAKTLLANVPNLPSSYYYRLPDPKVDTNGLADIFTGAKIQIVGEQAPIRAEKVRFAVAPGAIVPLNGPDFSEEVHNLLIFRKDATINKMDRHVFGTGGRFYFDWVVNKYFFLNFYNETIFYPVKQSLNRDGPALHATKTGLAMNSFIQGMVSQFNNQILGISSTALSTSQIMGISGDVDYKYRLTFEIEPVFTVPVADGYILSFGLPVNYRYIPAYDYSFEYPSTLSLFGMLLKPIILDNMNTDPQFSLNFVPNVSLFLTKTPLPLEFKFQYGLPVMGQNTMASHNMTFQIRVYFALPGRPQ